MSLYIPSLSEIMDVSASRGADSEAPDLWRGLVGWWPMQEGGGATAWDASGWRRNGTLTNGPIRAVSAIGRAVSFNNATNQYIDTGLTVGSDGLTLSVWVTRKGAGAFDWAMGASDSTSEYIYIGKQGDSDNWYAVGRPSGSGTQFTLTSPVPSVPANLALTISALSAGASAVAALYLNGVLVGSASFIVGGVGYSAIAGAIGIGWGGAGWGTARCIDSDLTNAGIWDRALLPSEIQQLYAEPWAMGTLRRRVFPAATASAIPIVSIMLAHGLYVGSQA